MLLRLLLLFLPCEKREKVSGALSCVNSRETSTTTVLHRHRKACRPLSSHFAGCHRRNGGEMATRGRSGRTVRVRANFDTLLLELQYLQSVGCNLSVGRRSRKVCGYSCFFRLSNTRFALFVEAATGDKRKSIRQLGESSLQFT